MAVGDSAFHNKRNFGISSGRSRKKSKILFPQFEWGKDCHHVTPGAVKRKSWERKIESACISYFSSDDCIGILLWWYSWSAVMAEQLGSSLSFSPPKHQTSLVSFIDSKAVIFWELWLLAFMLININSMMIIMVSHQSLLASPLSALNLSPMQWY